MNAPTAQRPNLPAAILLILITCLLAACGGGGSDEQSSSVTSQPLENNLPLGEIISGDYFPLETGSRWVYEVTVNDSWASTARYLSSQVVAGAATVGGQKSQLVRDINPENGDLIGLGYITKTSNTVSAYFEDNTPPIDIVRLPLRQGDHFVQVDRKNVDVGADYDGDGINETMSLFLEVTVVGFEEVQTPAGNFTQALKVQEQGKSTYRYSHNGEQIVVNHTTTNWYVNGVGQVKEIETLIAPNRNFTTTHTLKSYKVGSRTNDVTPPSIIQVSPAEGSLQGGLPVVRIQFSENIDVRTFNSVNIALRDASGQSIQGDINYVNQVLTFTPKQALASGRFTFYVGDAISDLLGNALNKQLDLHFNVDGDAPSVVASFPLPEAKMVPLDSSIIFDFSKALDLSTVNGSSIQLNEEDDRYTPFPISGSLVKVSATRIVFTPETPLRRNMRYSVHVDKSVKDLVGNTLTDAYSLTFWSDTGLFFPVNAIQVGSYLEAVAIDDLNGDGRNDVVITTSNQQDAKNDHSVMIFLQQSNGDLAEPIKYQFDACGVSTLVIADMTGDNKPEIIVDNCGIEILGQNGSGNWVSKVKIATSDTYKLAVADFNQDGKKDIVGLGWATNTVSVWYQNTKGELTSLVSYPLTHNGYEDMKLGDVNGDGLQDILVLSGQGDLSTAFGYLIQSHSGGFEEPRYLTIGKNSLSAIGVGDVNGDLRRDVVVAGGDLNVGVFSQQLSGGLIKSLDFPSGFSPNAVEIGDADNDGQSDIIGIYSNSIAIHKQMVDGVFQRGDWYPVSAGNINGLALGDINGDGYNDVVVAGSSGKLVVLYNRGASLLPRAVSTLKLVLNNKPQEIQYAGKYKVKIVETLKR